MNDHIGAFAQDELEHIERVLASTLIADEGDLKVWRHDPRGRHENVDAGRPVLTFTTGGDGHHSLTHAGDQAIRGDDSDGIVAARPRHRASRERSPVGVFGCGGKLNRLARRDRGTGWFHVHRGHGHEDHLDLGEPGDPFAFRRNHHRARRHAGDEPR